MLGDRNIGGSYYMRPENVPASEQFVDPATEAAYRKAMSEGRVMVMGSMNRSAMPTAK